VVISGLFIVTSTPFQAKPFPKWSFWPTWSLCGWVALSWSQP